MNRLRFVPTSAAVGALALLISSGPAFAATTYTVKAGTAASGTTTYTAATTGTGQQIKFRDITSNLNLGCNSGTAAGSIKLGNAVAGAGLATIGSTTWTACKGPLNLDLTVAQVGTWKINATGVTNAQGVTKGNISGVTANVTGSGCSFKVSGQVNGQVQTKGATQTLKVLPAATAAASKLVISNVVGCFNLVKNNDKASFAATYKITAAKGQLSVKSN